MKVMIHSEDELAALAKKIITLHPQGLYLFYGNVGAGKTTLIKYLCRLLGVDKTISSPTYTIVNEYFRSNNNIVLHADFYRLKNTEEIIDLGWDEYLSRCSHFFIEWPQLLENILPEEYLKIEITYFPQEQLRNVSLSLINHKSIRI